jgi:parvulin-like peptidyl-prolyl isomerase
MRRHRALEGKRRSALQSGAPWGGAAILCALLAVSLAGCGSGGPEGTVLAKVGGDDITVADFSQSYLAISIPNRPDLSSQEGRLSFLNDLVNKTILLQEGEKRGLNYNPNLEAGLTMLEDQLLRQEIEKRIILVDVEVPAEEVRLMYDRASEELNASHILCTSRDDAEQALAEIKAGADFADVARKYSADPVSARNGGELGWFTAGAMSARFEDAVYGLQVGEVSGIVQTEYGHHLIRLEDRRPRELGTFEEEKLNISSKLRRRKEGERRTRYMLNLRAKYQVDVIGEGLQALADVARRMEINSLVPWVDVAARTPPETQELPLVHFVDDEWTVGQFLTREGNSPVLGSPGQISDPHFLEQIVLQVAVDAALLKEARALGLDKSPEVVREVERRREQAIVFQVHDALTQGVTVPDDAVRQHFDDNAANLIRPETVKARRIEVHTRNEAERAIRRIRRGESFEKVAKEISHDIQAEKRGALEEYRRGQLPPETEEEVFSAGSGSLTRPIETLSGAWEIYLVEEHQEERPYTFEEVRDPLRAQLAERERDRVFNEWLTNARNDLGVEIFEDRLRDLTALGNEPAESA